LWQYAVVSARVRGDRFLCACAFEGFGKERGSWQTLSRLTGGATALWKSRSSNFVLMANTGANIAHGQTVDIHRLRGEQWVWEADPPRYIFGFWGRSDTDLYAVGGVGFLAHIVGDGVWSQQATGMKEELRHVWTLRGELLVASVKKYSSSDSG
jgi:hypothetical protein